MFKKAIEEEFDILVLAGDHSGSYYGYKGTRAVFSIAREYFKGPILAVLGNHDYWTLGRKKRSNDLNLVGIKTHRHYNPSLDAWNQNYRNIVESAKEHNIHLFEENGLFRFGEWNYTFAGHGLWYAIPPNGNDALYMPIGIDGDTHRYMYKSSTDALFNQLQGLDDSSDGIRIFVSHFPVIELEDSDLPWSGSPFIGSELRDQYKFTTFLNGHSHGDKNGPMRWECGGDYYNPKYKIIEV